MDDLISRRAAIDALANMYRAAEKWGQEADDDVIKARAESCMASLVEMKLRIEKLPSAQRWIPCSERLPEKVGRYLVTCEKWGAWAVDWNIWIGEPKSWLWEQGVTAWMPLPEAYEPPKEET